MSAISNSISCAIPPLDCGLPIRGNGPVRRLRRNWLSSAAALACGICLYGTDAKAIDVASEADWATAVAAVAVAASGSTTVINFTGGFTLTSSLAAIQANNANVTVSITGNNLVIDGASTYQGIQVNGSNAPTVNISNLAVSNTRAAGGSGGVGQDGYYSGGLAYGSGGGGGGGLGAGGGLLVGATANVTLSSVTFTGNAAQGGAGGIGGSAQNAASSGTGGNGGDGGAANNGGSAGGGGAGGLGGNGGTQGTTGAPGPAFGDGGGGGGGSGTTASSTYTSNNAPGSGNANGGSGGRGGDGATNASGSGGPGPGSDGGNGGVGGAGQGGAIYVAAGGTLTILDSAIGGAGVTGGAGAAGGIGVGPSAINGGAGSAGAAAGAAIYLGGVMANIGVSTGTVTYANSIGGTGLASGGVTSALTKTGVGTMVLSAANDFTGNVNITAGTVSISATTNLGNVANDVVISNGGVLAVTATTTLASGRAFMMAGSSTIDVAAATTTTLQGVVGNGGSAGSLVKSGDGTLLLSATNTYTGSTTINAGTLRAGSLNALPSGTALSVASGASFDANGFARVVGSLAGGGTVTNGGGAAVALTAGGDGGSTEFSGVIQNGTNAISLAKSGTGTLALTGASAYTGATTVNAGTLSVNGSIASSTLTTVNSSGTLGGTGTVGATTINGGTLAPGNSIGTLSVQGNLSFTAASIYMIEVSPAAADRVNVSGSATLGSATVSASFAAGSYVDRQYTIVNAVGGVSGSFGSLLNTNLPSGFRSSLGYDANNVYLNLALDFTPTPGAAINTGLNANQTSTANALSGYFARTGSIPIVFGSLTPAGLSLASGETATGVQNSTVAMTSQFLGGLTDPFTERGEPVAAITPAFADDGSRRNRTNDAFAMFGKAPPLAPAVTRHWSVWAAGFGGTQSFDGNAAQGSRSTTSRIVGTTVGADYWLSPFTRLGFALAGGTSSVSIGVGSGRSDLFQAGAYLRHQIGASYVNAALAYGWQDVSTERNFGGPLTGAFNVNSLSGRLEAGSRVATPLGVAITPYAAAQFTSLALPGYSELAPGNVFALSYDGKDVTAWRSELGLRSNRSYALTSALLTLRGRAAWAHDFDTERGITATFQSLPGASFVVKGAAAAPDVALLSAGAELSWRNGMSFAATFDGEFSETSRSYAGKGVVRYQW